MTIINVDGFQVIYEGVRRLRWVYSRTWTQVHLTGNSAPMQRIVESVWPNLSTQAHLRRQIEHGQRTVVILDDKPPVLKLPRECIPRVPTGAIELDRGDDQTRTLLIPPLTWLSAANRARGEEFLSGARQVDDGAPRPGSTGPVIEDDLIGTRENLRFIYCARDITIGEMRDVVGLMFEPRRRARRPARGGAEANDHLILPRQIHGPARPPVPIGPRDSEDAGQISSPGSVPQPRPFEEIHNVA